MIMANITKTKLIRAAWERIEWLCKYPYPTPLCIRQSHTHFKPWLVLCSEWKASVWEVNGSNPVSSSPHTEVSMGKALTQCECVIEKRCCMIMA